jgi:hypothetical protein
MNKRIGCGCDILYVEDRIGGIELSIGAKQVDTELQSGMALVFQM